MSLDRLSNEDWERRVLDHEVSREAVEKGMDWYLASMESLSIAIRQRQMTPEQMERYARLLNASESDLLRRMKPGEVAGPRSAPTPKSRSQGKQLGPRFTP